MNACVSNFLSLSLSLSLSLISSFPLSHSLSSDVQQRALVVEVKPENAEKKTKLKRDHLKNGELEKENRKRENEGERERKLVAIKKCESEYCIEVKKRDEERIGKRE